MGRSRITIVVLSVFGACSQDQSPGAADAIRDIPANQQRVVTRSEFESRWPFTGGIGTLGCISGAVVFRFADTSYAVNDAAKSRGFAVSDPIRQTRSSGPPRDPFKGLLQHQRMQVFAAAANCDGGMTVIDANRCKERLRAAHSPSEADLEQIEAEGRERRWPPLSPDQMPLDPLIEAGLALRD